MSKESFSVNRPRLEIDHRTTCIECSKLLVTETEREERANVILLLYENVVYYEACSKDYMDFGKVYRFPEQVDVITNIVSGKKEVEKEDSDTDEEYVDADSEMKQSTSATSVAHRRFLNPCDVLLVVAVVASAVAAIFFSARTE